MSERGGRIECGPVSGQGKSILAKFLQKLYYNRMTGIVSEAVAPLVAVLRR